MMFMFVCQNWVCSCSWMYICFSTTGIWFLRDAVSSVCAQNLQKGHSLHLYFWGWRNLRLTFLDGGSVCYSCICLMMCSYSIHTYKKLHSGHWSRLYLLRLGAIALSLTIPWYTKSFALTFCRENLSCRIRPGSLIRWSASLSGGQHPYRVVGILTRLVPVPDKGKY